MDPVSALSLVANIFAVISFTGEVLSTATQIKEKGSTERHGELFLLSRDLKKTAARLHDSIEDSSAVKKLQHNEADMEIIELASKAVTTASHVSDLMDKFRPKDIAIWNVIKKTGLAILKKREIEEAEQRLKDLRDQLNFRLVVSLRDKMDAQLTLSSEAFMALDAQTRDIAAKFLESQVGLDAILSAQLNSNRQAAKRHHEIMASLGKGESEEQCPIISSELSSRKLLWNMDRAFRTSLWYPTMEERQQGIWSAHKGTLDWVFQDSPAEKTVPWDDFNHFVTKGCGTYWITGKAGSGKSTLMKYINTNPKLDVALSEWAAGHEIFKASFYFYYLGTEMQKSEMGLLRSLVLELLSTHQKPEPMFWRGEEQRFFTHLGSQNLALNTERIRIAFPERFESMQLSSKRPASFEPSRNELLMALNRIFQHSPDARFFLSIDGLDEYDAESTEMSDLAEILKSICQRQNVKAVISSRPWAVFEDAFTARPRLRLHQLTHDDISFYVSDKMEHDHRMQRLLRFHPEESKALMEEIVEASAGVFLWVRLVVQSLMEGLVNRDGVSDMQLRLRDLPTDLDELYRVMLKRVPDSYRRQTSRLLELVYYGTRDKWKLSLFGLHYAFELGEEEVLRAPIEPWPSQELDWVFESMERIIQSRCLGFVEVVHLDTICLAHGPDTFDTRSKQKSAVRFIHRSAVDFLRQPDTWSQYITNWKDASFEPSLALLCSAIHTLKRLHFDKTMESVGIIRSMALYAGYRALEAEHLTKQASPALLLELDRVMEIQVNQLCFEFSPRSRTTFLSFAASLQLRYFVQNQVACHGPQIVDQEQDSLLAYVEEARNSQPGTLDEPHISVDPELVKFLKGLSRRAMFSKKRVLQMWSSKKARKKDVLGQPIISAGP
ncbi:small s protein [Diaporthe eres]|nr:small s protein [Diaporthe eres]